MVSAPGRLTGIFILVFRGVQIDIPIRFGSCFFRHRLLPALVPVQLLQPAFFRRRGHGDGGCERRSGGGDRAAGFASVQGRFHACDARCVRMVRLRAYDGFQLALLARSLFRRDPIRGATRHRRRNRSGRRRDHLDFLFSNGFVLAKYSSTLPAAWLFHARSRSSWGIWIPVVSGMINPVHSRPVGVRVLAGDDAP